MAVEDYQKILRCGMTTSRCLKRSLNSTVITAPSVIPRQLFIGITGVSVVNHRTSNTVHSVISCYHTDIVCP